MGCGRDGGCDVRVVGIGGCVNVRCLCVSGMRRFMPANEDTYINFNCYKAVFGYRKHAFNGWPGKK